MYSVPTNIVIWNSSGEAGEAMGKSNMMHPNATRETL